MGFPLRTIVFCDKCGCAYSRAKWTMCPIDGNEGFEEDNS